jgi:UDPglucose 6-dehydrogenase
MNISIFGTGYVGLVSAGCFASKNHNVICYDTNSERIESLIKGHIPIYEPGLEELLTKGFNSGKLKFTSSPKDSLINSDVVMICVGTPDIGSGETNLEAIENCAKTISKHSSHDLPILIKSTVPVGTCLKVQNIIKHDLLERDKSINIIVASNPEFLHEGVAIFEFYKPDRIVLGTDNQDIVNLTYELYKNVMPENEEILVMSCESSELTKYASNSFLATKISYMNQISQFCSLVGANIDDVRKGMGPDPDIAPGYLYAGCGFGGSCLPKDINSLIHQADKKGKNLSILKAVRNVNEDQKKYLVSIASSIFNNNFKDTKIAIWGLSFKPKTDDMRGAPSLTIIQKLLEFGAIVECYDPVVSYSNQSFEIKHESLNIALDKYEVANNADCLIICTEWAEFKEINYKKLAQLMNRKIILDGRNILIPEEAHANKFEYYDIGRAVINNKISDTPNS